MKEIGVAVFANTCITMQNLTKVYVEDDITSIERRMKDPEEEIVITISATLEGINRSIKKSEIKEWKEM